MLRTLITLFTLCLAVIGCKRETGPAAGDPAGLTAVSLQLNWKPEPQFGGFYAAEVIGAYGKHGLKATVAPGGVGTPTVQMVAAGKVEFGVCSADEIALARANGADVVGLFAVYQTNPQGILTHAARGFDDIADVFATPGTLAMQRGLPYADFLERKYGFDKLTVVPSPGGDLSKLRTDKDYAMQCFVTSEPVAARAAGLDVKAFLIADAGYNPYTTVLTTRGDYARANPKVVKSMVDAVREGWQAYLTDPAATDALIARENPSMDAATINASAAAQVPLIQTDETKASGLGVMTLDRWRTLCRQLEELKVVEKAPDPASCFMDVSKR